MVFSLMYVIIYTTKKLNTNPTKITFRCMFHNERSK